MIKKESGVALFFTLIILLIVVMVGVTAMRSSLFHERMAFNSQAEDLSFQAAESGINSVIQLARIVEDDGNGPAASLLTRVLAGQTIPGCVTLQTGFAEGECDQVVEHTLDSRESILSSSITEFELATNAVGFDPAIMVDLQFVTEGGGRYLTAIDLPFENANVQQWRKLGPPNGWFEDSSDELHDDEPGDAQAPE